MDCITHRTIMLQVLKHNAGACMQELAKGYLKHGRGFLRFEFDAIKETLLAQPVYTPQSEFSDDGLQEMVERYEPSTQMILIGTCQGKSVCAVVEWSCEWIQ